MSVKTNQDFHHYMTILQRDQWAGYTVIHIALRIGRIYRPNEYNMYDLLAVILGFLTDYQKCTKGNSILFPVCVSMVTVYNLFDYGLAHLRSVLLIPNIFMKCLAIMKHI